MWKIPPPSTVATPRHLNCRDPRHNPNNPWPFHQRPTPSFLRLHHHIPSLFLALLPDNTYFQQLDAEGVPWLADLTCHRQNSLSRANFAERSFVVVVVVVVGLFFFCVCLDSHFPAFNGCCSPLYKVSDVAGGLLNVPASCKGILGTGVPPGWVRSWAEVCWLLDVPATCKCISGTDLHRQFDVLPHWDGSCRSNFPSRPVTVYWHRADQSQRWPYDTRRLAG